MSNRSVPGNELLRPLASARSRRVSRAASPYGRLLRLPRCRWTSRHLPFSVRRLSRKSFRCDHAWTLACFEGLGLNAGELGQLDSHDIADDASQPHRLASTGTKPQLPQLLLRSIVFPAILKMRPEERHGGHSAQATGTGDRSQASKMLFPIGSRSSFASAMKQPFTTDTWSSPHR